MASIRGLGPMMPGRQRGRSRSKHADSHSEFSETFITKPGNQQYENTYRVKPTDENKFRGYTIERAVMEVLEGRLENIKYDPIQAANLTKELSTSIRNKLKDLNFPRYKYVVNVVLGQNAEQSVAIASRNLWDPAVDNYAAVTYKNKFIFATAVMFAAYFE
ncbi:dynein light chain Tctex-type protein 2B-like [Lineus longissimus]|uniref:dynein light chain Tctex-type protein 2B-like n=1 Tax=Lineus longissimus TaxID=88925 RepID=UPI002B4CAA8A